MIRSTVKTQINACDYFNCLRTNKSSEFKQNQFISKKQHLYLESFTKIGLSSFDLKRFWLSDGIQSVPFNFPPSFYPTFHAPLSLESSPLPSTLLKESFTATMLSISDILQKIQRLKDDSLVQTMTTTTSTKRVYSETMTAGMEDQSNSSSSAKASKMIFLSPYFECSFIHYFIHSFIHSFIHF